MTAVLSPAQRLGRLGFWVVLGALAIAGVGAGLYARFFELGIRPLASDEFFTFEAARFILNTGLPEYAGGGYYLRAILHEYLTAASLYLLGLNNFAARLPSALLSLGSVVLIYLYGRRFLDRPTAIAVALTLLVSSWHIEFARFARMYSLFQFLTLAFLLCYDKAYFRDRWRLRYAPHVLVVLTVLTHALGILLLPLLFMPLIGEKTAERFPSWRERARFTAMGLATIAVCYAYLKTNVHRMGVVDPLPIGYVQAASSEFQTPAFPFWSLSADPVINLLLYLGLSAGAAAIFWVLRWRGRDVRDTDILLALALIASAMHFLAVAGLFLAVVVFRYRIHKPEQHPARTYILFLLSVLGIVAWLAFALFDRSWTANVDGGQFGLVWSLRRTFFGWPDLYQLHYLPWARELPEIGALVAAALAYLAVSRLRDPVPELLRHPAFILIFMALLLSVLAHPAPTVRYAYFVYPVMLCVLALAIREVVSRLARLAPGLGDVPVWVSVALYLGVFAFSSDFNPGHIANVASEEVSFRTGPYARFESIWYPRADFATPAEFVAKRLENDPAARAIVIAPQAVLHYLPGGQAIYFSRDVQIFEFISRARGTVNAWTGGPLLTTPEAVRGYTKDVETVWLIRFKPWAAYHPLSIEETWGDRLIDRTLAFESRDGRLEVIRIKVRAGT